ncbi:ribokinase [Ornithinibacillus halotolerans]|uniref:Ribokinase n=1 Tax=Ornithinibacillus halotolerans TaxID=1274357 RepID=A0A916W9I3_9BACI|nr:ribokinase [Ornithinibacillus halotolerans]GGA79199.1 ribokinase [Ornithinibacillus halotolerans]
MNTPTITVIGSINIDLVTVFCQMPEQGETVMGERFQTNPGGKGANQAVAAARLGANVQMIGRVGDDQHGQDMIQSLEKERVSTKMIGKVPNINTGTANILISDRDNRIIIVPGANYEVTPEYVKQFEQEMKSSDLVLVQFEIPDETILYCLDFCHEHNIPIIVNPAPAKQLPAAYWPKATYITPNESEAKQLFHGEENLDGKLIITQGEKGVSYHRDHQKVTVPAHTVNPVDTTGAGDTFNGALAVAISENMDLEDAITFANAASALSIQKFGAQDGMPTRTELTTFMKVSMKVSDTTRNNSKNVE